MRSRDRVLFITFSKYVAAGRSLATKSHPASPKATEHRPPGELPRNTTSTYRGHFGENAHTVPSREPANVRGGHIMCENIDLKATPTRFAYAARFSFPPDPFQVPIRATSVQPVPRTRRAMLLFSNGPWATRQFELRPIVSLRRPLTRTAARLLGTAAVIFSPNRISCS